MSGTILIIGASRGLGLALAEAYLARGWHVIATARQRISGQGLDGLSEGATGKLRIEMLDINDVAQIERLRDTLQGVPIDALFVNAGITNDPAMPVDAVNTADFTAVMETNALAPLRVIAQFADQVSAQGTIAVMSSILGSVAGNDRGGWEVYRMSKAALNMGLRSLVARRAGDTRTYLAVAPGWVRTDMGGAGAPLEIADSIPRVVDMIARRTGKGGIAFVDYQDRELPW